MARKNVSAFPMPEVGKHYVIFNGDIRRVNRITARLIDWERVGGITRVRGFQSGICDAESWHARSPVEKEV